MSLINREALLSYADLWASCGEHYTAEDVIMMIKTAPTVDAVPVVRCRECKHYDTADFDGDILCGCTLHSAMLDITPDSFCSYGEKKVLTMPDCKHCQDEVCVNADCPMCADFCPVPDIPGVCRFEEREEAK